jgi:ribonucleotide monophosphatase NagD (HAD superfamily)
MTAFFTNLPDWAKPAPIERVSFDEAEGIICTGPVNEMKKRPKIIAGGFCLPKARGLKLLCANPDIVVDYGDTRIYCAGALAEALYQMGARAFISANRTRPIYDLARRIAAQTGLKISEDRTIAIGDGIHTDVQGGIAEGVDTLFITGGLAAANCGPDVENPDPQRLQGFLARKDRHPTFAIGRLR